jgi:hypothetical protein
VPLDLDKETAGQPRWVWLAGGLAVVGGLVYLLYKSRQAGMGGADSGASSSGAAGPQLTGVTTSQLQGWLANHQGSTTTTKKTTCPAGYHWNPKQHRCVKTRKRKHMPKV